MTDLHKPWPITRLLSIPVDCVSRTDLLAFVQSRVLARDQQLHIVTMNAEMAHAATADPALMAALQQADLIIPDGIGVVWALGRQGIRVERLPGIELVQELLRRSAEGQLKVGILGSSQTTLDQLEPVLTKRFGPVQRVYTRNGFFSPAERPGILADINAAAPDVLFVALGVPRQELFIAEFRSQLQAPILIGVGGSFDVISGQLKRAPLWMQKAHLEWFYRLLQQPSRWRRMLALPLFVLQVTGFRP